MPKSYEKIAIWAQGCSHRAHAGMLIAENIEASEFFSTKRRARAANAVRNGKSLYDCLLHFYPDLSFGDIAFLETASKTGQLAKGFDLISRQYFAKAKVMAFLMSAFIYPIGVVLIGIFLISLQSVLYEKSNIRVEAIDFALRIFFLMFALYLVKSLLLLRPPALSALMRGIPPFRKLSGLFALQRLVWVLNEGSHSAMPVDQMFYLAGQSSRKPGHIRRLDLLVKRLSKGERFDSAFKDFDNRLPKSIRGSISVLSPYDLPNWSGLIASRINTACGTTLETIQKLSKPIALVLISPLLVWVIQRLWHVMVEQLGQRFQQIF